jgi:hypothetical protein
MRTHLLLLTAALLVSTGCPARGSGGGSGDDDDDVGGTSAAWVVETWSDGDESGQYHDLVMANVSNICGARREAGQLFQELDEQYNDGYDAIEEKFGDTDAPGAKEAICELEKEWYADFLAADVAYYRPGTVYTYVSFYGPGFEDLDSLDPGGYVESSTADGETEPIFSGSRVRITSLDWYEGWEDVDCSDEDAVETYQDAYEGESYEDLEQGTIWVSAPSDNVRGFEAEGVLLVDEDDAQQTLDLDVEATRCAIETD